MIRNRLIWFNDLSIRDVFKRPIRKVLWYALMSRVEGGPVTVIREKLAFSVGSAVPSPLLWDAGWTARFAGFALWLPVLLYDAPAQAIEAEIPQPEGRGIAAESAVGKADAPTP